MLDFLTKLKVILIGLRKTISFWGFTALAAWLLVRGYIPGDTWLAEMKMVFAAYMGANAGERLSNVLVARYFGGEDDQTQRKT